MNGYSGALHILAVSERGVQCATSEGEAFWLPRSGHVQWARPPQPGAVVTAIVPGWLAAKHRQLVGDVAYESVRHANTRKEDQMSNSRDNSGALFRVADDEKKTDKWPDYKGDATIHGHKFWVSAWIKTSATTGKKFMSLAFRPAEERTEAPKAKAPAMVDNEIPF